MMWVNKVSDAFVESEDGAVSADWVMLTAFCIGIGVAGILGLGGSVADYSVDVESALSDRGIPTFGTGDGGAGL